MGEHYNIIKSFINPPCCHNPLSVLKSEKKPTVDDFSAYIVSNLDPGLIEEYFNDNNNKISEDNCLKVINFIVNYIIDCKINFKKGL